MAFFYLKKIDMRSVVKSKYVEYPNGEKPQPHTNMVCGNCKKDIKLKELITKNT